ncbi:hypothetical protein BGZ59_002404, partial [Podila verticillata]
VLPSPTSTSTTVATPTPNTTSSTTTTSTLPLVTQPSKSGSDGKSNTGLIAGAVAGALAVILIAAGLVFLRRRKRINQELKEAELYQQQRVMRQNDDDNNGSSTVYGFGGLGRARGDDVERGNNEYLLKQTGANVQRQPSWWSRKKPHEYYQQVPPRDYLQRTKQQRQEQDMGQQGSGVRTTINKSAYGPGGVDHRVHDIPEAIPEASEPLQPWQQTQPPNDNPNRQNAKALLRLNENALYSTKRASARHEYSPSRPLSSIEPVSPIGSVFEEVPNSLPYSPAQSRPLPSNNNRSRARSSIPYPPPPVLTSLTASVPVPPASKQDTGKDSYRPPTGFYDFDEDEANTAQFASGYQPHQLEPQQTPPPQQSPPLGGVIPPPIPRATRPTSISTKKSRSNTHLGHRIPPLPTSPVSPVSPTGSEHSGPKVGGRRARVKSRNKGIPNVSP